MMRVRLEVMPWLSELVNGDISRKASLDQTLAEGSTLRDLLLKLHEGSGRLGPMIYDPKRGQLTGHAEISVNGSLYDAAGGLDSPLHDGDVVAILPGIAGG